LIKYTKSVLWRVEKLLSYTEDAQCLKVKDVIPIKKEKMEINQAESVK